MRPRLSEGQQISSLVLLYSSFMQIIEITTGRAVSAYMKM
jgi:hypothetical protein